MFELDIFKTDVSRLHNSLEWSGFDQEIAVFTEDLFVKWFTLWRCAVLVGVNE